MLPRHEITEALKAINEKSKAPRLEHLRKALLAAHPERIVNRALGDLDSYPDWHLCRHLDAAPAAKPKSKRRKK